MKRVSHIILIVSIINIFFGLGAALKFSRSATARVEAQVTVPCGIASPAFCETFSQGGTGGARSPALPPYWGVSRATGFVNLGQTEYNAGIPSTMQSPCGTQNVQPPNDVQICNGQLVDSVNDNTNVTTLAMYPKQPFDFAGRTGKITFDVSNDSGGNHAAWPELWVTDKPMPAPFDHEATWQTNPQNGFGVRFAGACNAGNACGGCQGTPSLVAKVTIDSAVVVNNYISNDSFQGGSLKVQDLACVVESTGTNGDQPGNAGLNHFEVDVSASEIDVYGTDAGTTSPLIELAKITGFTLGLTRGLVWIEDVHYNASKFGPPDQQNHTFLWDNVGFDGPLLPRDLTFDVPDALQPNPNGNGTLNLGYLVNQNQSINLPINGVTGIGQASAGFILANFQVINAPTTISYSLNSGPNHTEPWPYPDTLQGTWRTIALPIPPTEAQTGSNTLKIGADQYLVVSNVDLLLVGAGGIVPCNCGGNPPPTATPTSTSTPSPTPTPTQTPAPSSFSSSALETPNPVQQGSTAGFTVSAKNTGTQAANALVDLELYDPTGNKAFQQYWDNQRFAAGQTLSFGPSWPVTNSAMPGTYTAKIGVFSAGWGTLYAWNNAAAQFSVSASNSPQRPSAPTNVSAISGPGSGQATVTWVNPAAGSGPAITSYTVTAQTGNASTGITATVKGATTTSAVVSLLTIGTTYTFTVHATSSAGNSPESAPSNSVTPGGGSGGGGSMTIIGNVRLPTAMPGIIAASVVGGSNPCPGATVIVAGSNPPFSVTLPATCGTAGASITFTVNGTPTLLTTGSSPCLVFLPGTTASNVTLLTGQPPSTSCTLTPPPVSPGAMHISGTIQGVGVLWTLGASVGGVPCAAATESFLGRLGSKIAFSGLQLTPSCGIPGQNVVLSVNGLPTLLTTRATQCLAFSPGVAVDNVILQYGQPPSSNCR